MAGQPAQTAPPAPSPPDAALCVRRLAARAWVEMDGAGVLPTPRNFELWYTHLSGADPELSRRLSALIGNGEAPAEAALDALYADRLTPETALDAVVDGAEAIQQAAQAVVERIAGNGQALQEYGAALSHAAVQLGQDRTVDGLLRAVATLTLETARASERNRALEQQLSASTARIGKLRQNLAEVKQEAAVDDLTGLVNRRAFDARLRRAVSRAKTDAVPLALLLLDVDHFKHVNDTYGHKVGDLVLRLVGRLLADNVKGRDTAARYGGEEFAVILAGADLRAGAIVGEQMRAALDGKRLVNKGSGQHLRGVTVSVGVAQLRPGEAASALVERADAALYRAKNHGRNQVCTEDAAVGAAA